MTDEMQFNTEVITRLLGSPTGQRSRSQRDVLGNNICQSVNNSAEGCSISIKLTTDYDHVTPALPQTFKVNGSKVKAIA